MMTHNDVINQYFKAWESKDVNLLKSLFSDNNLVIRTPHKSLIFSDQKLIEQFSQFDKVVFSIGNIDDENQEIIVTLTATYYKKNEELKMNLIMKFVFKDILLTRVYETTHNPEYSRIVCVVSYDGSVYNGFQRQINQPTVQGDIEKGLYYLTKEHITIHSSGRTDKGVHAHNQVFHFDTKININPSDFHKVLNNYLPDTIHIKSSFLASQTFHTRYDSVYKEYCYKINTGEYDPIQRNYEWATGSFDISIFKKEMLSIIGTHNFTSFTKTKEDKEMVRTIFDVSFTEKDGFLLCYIKGNGFLHFMVRYLIGTAIEIAKNKIDLSMLDLVALQDSSAVRWKAPSSGLYLSKVKYNNY